jgi:hypothetical protein
LLSGTFASGTFTITASNTLTGVSVSKTLTYTETAISPVVTGINPNEATFGSFRTITIDIRNGATGVTVEGLPAGLTHGGRASLIISGTPTQAGVSNVTITATNSAGANTQTIPLTVLPGTAPVIDISSPTISATQDERFRDAALLKAVGASSPTLAAIASIELAIVGGLSGLLGGFAAAMAAWALGHFILEIEFNSFVSSIGLGVVFGLIACAIAGYQFQRKIQRAPAIDCLREA